MPDKPLSMPYTPMCKRPCLRLPTFEISITTNRNARIKIATQATLCILPLCVCVLVMWRRVTSRHARLAPAMLQDSHHFNITNLLFVNWFGHRQRLTPSLIFKWNRSRDNEEKYTWNKVCRSLIQTKSAMNSRRSGDKIYIARTYGIVVFDNEPLEAGVTQLNCTRGPQQHMFSFLSCMLKLIVLPMCCFNGWVW